jgi:hypothetical protein
VRKVRKELVAKKKLEFERLTKENLVLSKDGGKWGMEWVDQKFEKYKKDKAQDEKKFAAEVEALKGLKPIEYDPVPPVKIPEKSKKPDKKLDLKKISVEKMKEIKKKVKNISTEPVIKNNLPKVAPEPFGPDKFFKFQVKFRLNTLAAKYLRGEFSDMHLSLFFGSKLAWGRDLFSEKRSGGKYSPWQKLRYSEEEFLILKITHGAKLYSKKIFFSEIVPTAKLPRKNWKFMLDLLDSSYIGFIVFQFRLEFISEEVYNKKAKLPSEKQIKKRVSIWEVVSRRESSKSDKFSDTRTVSKVKESKDQFGNSRLRTKEFVFDKKTETKTEEKITDDIVDPNRKILETTQTIFDLGPKSVVTRKEKSHKEYLGTDLKNSRKLVSIFDSLDGFLKKTVETKTDAISPKAKTKKRVVSIFDVHQHLTSESTQNKIFKNSSLSVKSTKNWQIDIFGNKTLITKKKKFSQTTGSKISEHLTTEIQAKDGTLKKSKDTKKKYSNEIEFDTISLEKFFSFDGKKISEKKTRKTYDSGVILKRDVSTKVFRKGKVSGWRHKVSIFDKIDKKLVTTSEENGKEVWGGRLVVHKETRDAHGDLVESDNTETTPDEKVVKKNIFKLGKLSSKRRTRIFYTAKKRNSRKGNSRLDDGRNKKITKLTLFDIANGHRKSEVNTVSNYKQSSKTKTVYKKSSLRVKTLFTYHKNSSKNLRAKKTLKFSIFGKSKQLRSKKSVFVTYNKHSSTKKKLVVEKRSIFSMGALHKKITRNKLYRRNGRKKIDKQVTSVFSQVGNKVERNERESVLTLFDQRGKPKNKLVKDTLYKAGQIFTVSVKKP